MMRTRAAITLLALLLGLQLAPAQAQNFNFIAPTPPPGSSNNQIATTAFVQSVAGAANLTVATSTIIGGTTTRVLYDNAGVLGEYTSAQLTALINTATASLSGALPAWPNNTTTFFRGDGTYTAVGNASLANMSAGTVKCNDGGLAAAPSDCAHIAFYLHKNGTNQTAMLTSAYDRVTWSTAKFNNGGGTFSGNRWTAPVAGYIYMNATVFYTANLANGVTETVVLKIIKDSAGNCNGTDVFAGIGTPWSGINFGTAQANGIDLAAAGDVYEVCSFAVSSNAANDIQIDGNIAHTHWSGSYMR